MVDDFANEKKSLTLRKCQNENRTLQTFKRYRLIRIAILGKVQTKLMNMRRE